LATIAIDFKMKLVKFKDMKIKLQIWDTAGQERFNSFTNGYFKGSDGILVAFSLTDKKSYECVKKWMEKVQQMAEENVPFIIIANKLDHPDRQITEQEIQDLEKQYKTQVIQTSAKSGENIDFVFTQICQKLYPILQNRKQTSDLD
jgi:small GTP-binding protein